MDDDNWRFFRWKPWRDWPVNTTEEKWRRRDNEFAREMWGKRLGFLFLFRCKNACVKEIKHFSNIWVRSNEGKTQKWSQKLLMEPDSKKWIQNVLRYYFFCQKIVLHYYETNLTFNLTQCKSKLVTMNYKSYIITYNP